MTADRGSGYKCCLHRMPKTHSLKKVPILRLCDWCGREDLNLHPFEYMHLKHARPPNSATTAYIKLVQTSSHAYLKLVRLPTPGNPRLHRPIIRSNHRRM